MLLASKSIARFTVKKNFSGSININNHPGSPSFGPGAKTILDKEGGIDFIKAKGTPDFSEVATTKEGMFMAEDDYGESYYYRGEADNWVSFAGFYWRIIRINGDGSIRLIYTGTKDLHTTSLTEIGEVKYNERADSEKYADYKISKIKSRVDNWYRTNILGKGFNNKIADTGYCNDMTKTSKSEYGAFDRLSNHKKPTLKCPNKENDLLTINSEKLMFPVGLITWDELSFAGGVWWNPNEKYYLHSGSYYWTMTPTGFVESKAGVGITNYNGEPYFAYVYAEHGIRPVLSLKPSVRITSGDGTETNPFIVN